MRLEAIRIQNFKALKNFVLEDIPDFCVLVGANGTGKSTLFRVFDFLRDAMEHDIERALLMHGGPRGFHEVRTRNETGPIEIELKYRTDRNSPRVTYLLQIDLEQGRPVVSKEILKYRRGSTGRPWHFMDFKLGQGTAVTNELEEVTSESQLDRQEEKLKTPNLLAIKALSQLSRFPAAVALGEMIENWHISDFHIENARGSPDYQPVEHLDRTGENLPLVIDYYHRNHPDVLERIFQELVQRVPGIHRVETVINDENQARLKFYDKNFEEPFLARDVSDGTVKMLAYLALLHDPTSHPLVCVEEPENQLYPTLLPELAEEFRGYALRGGQVFVSTHSPDFLNAVELEEAFFLVKSRGHTSAVRAMEQSQITSLVEAGDKLGYLWKQGLFPMVDPQP